MIEYRDDKSETNSKKNKKADVISFDDDGPATQTQSKLNFGSARVKPIVKAKASTSKASTSKGKSRVIIQDDSDEEEDELATPSATYNQENDRMDLDSDEEDQLASQKSVAKKVPAKATARKPAASTSSSAKAKAAPAVKAKAPAKAAPKAKAAAVPKKRAAVVSDDDSDEGFAGLTYTTGVKRRK